MNTTVNGKYHDAGRMSGSTENLRGKILRIHPNKNRLQHTGGQSVRFSRKGASGSLRNGNTQPPYWIEHAIPGYLASARHSCNQSEVSNADPRKSLTKKFFVCLSISSWIASRMTTQAHSSCKEPL